ncbi:MAG: carbohydrate kinase [Gammaproteobacteria bacterium]|nr:carbohydrate kinase [Gammaproteobacteria bacterium]
MTDEPLFLAIDFGTQSVRAIVFDLHGASLVRAAVPIPAPRSPEKGWAEQDAEKLWQWLCEACRKASSELDDATRIKAVAVTTMRATVIPVDASGDALRPAILWPDQRRTKSAPPIGGLNGLLLRIAGVSNTIRFFQSEAEANWLAIHEPDLWHKTSRFLLLSGYFNFRLTGEYRDSASSQIAFVPFDFRRKRWASKNSWKWQALPWLRREQLPELVMPGDTTGSITTKAAAETGLVAGTPVIAAAADKACEVLGAGGGHRGTACLSYGTAATVNVSCNRYREIAPFIPPYPAAQPDRWNLEKQVSQGFWLVDWFKKEFGQPELEQARSQSVSTESLLDQLLDASAPGAGGLMSQPFWAPGLRSPGPEARGAIIGLNPSSNRADIYRALLEGILYALRQGLEQIGKRLGASEIDNITVTGGGAGSDAVMQLTANIFGRPVSRAAASEASALGSAINAAVGLGYFADYKEAIEAMTLPGQLFNPDPELSQQYETLYQNLYLPLYSNLKPIFESFQQQNDHDNLF